MFGAESLVEERKVEDEDRQEKKFPDHLQVDDAVNDAVDAAKSSEVEEERKGPTRGSSCKRSCN